MRYPSSVIVFIPQKAMEIEDCSSQITAATFPSLPIPCSLSVSTHTMPSQVYGPEHLLRLFGKLFNQKKWLYNAQIAIFLFRIMLRFLCSESQNFS